MPTDEDRLRRADYRLDLEVDGALLLLHVDGPEGPTLRKHLDEVRQAAERCGLQLVVNGRGPDDQGMWV